MRRLAVLSAFCIALFGQAVLNGVVMVTYFSQLRDAGLDPAKAVMQGSLLRLRTVLMTALLAMHGAILLFNSSLATPPPVRSKRLSPKSTFTAWSRPSAMKNTAPSP